MTTRIAIFTVRLPLQLAPFGPIARPLSNAPTIYALASAPGRAGVAVFRISGPKALDAVRALGITKPLAPRLATLGTLIYQGNQIDQALCLFFPISIFFHWRGCR